MPIKYLKRIAFTSNISTYLSRTLIIITLATTLLIGGALIVLQTIQFKKVSTQKSQEYIQDQKNYIKEIVTNEISYILAQNQDFRENIHKKIRQNVIQANLTAEMIYHKYEGSKSAEEIKSLIIATISSLKFENEYEEVYISTLDGTGIYYPRRPEFTGKNMKNFLDSNGKPVVMAETNLLKTKPEGFLDYIIETASSENGSTHEKIAFVKKFDHFDWYFGSKQNLDNYYPKFREEIAQKISSVRFRHGGYVFLNQIDGTPIVMDGKVYKGDLNLLKQSGDPRHSVFLKELETTKDNPSGGYFYYKWNKLNDTIPSEKCAYVHLFKESNWLIGAGFYLDEVNESITEQQRILRQDQKKSILIIFLILITLLFIEAVIIHHFNKKYKSDFERFFNFFFLSQDSFKKLNISEFNFDEFRRAGDAANKMIELREEIESKLIEEQKRATESDRLKSAFLANMSHEIRTPMNAIIGFSELLEDESQDKEDLVIFIKLIQKNGEMLLNLINDIIDISKIEANLLTVKKRPVNLSRFLDEICSHYHESILSKKDKNIQFNLNNEVETESIILTDEHRLKQILDNLIGNAIKFTSIGSVKLEVKKTGDFIHFSITDTGIGIPYDQQVTIFERFIQSEQAYKMNFGGTGLGLAISRNLIELLGGTIHVKSEMGKGSTFYFNIQAN
jgi:signal transduction histidine kinase